MTTRSAQILLTITVALVAPGCGDDATTSPIRRVRSDAGIGPGGIYIPDASLDGIDDDGGYLDELVPRNDGGACFDPVSAGAFEFSVKVDEQPYVIHGSTAEELRAQMDLLHPADGDYPIGWTLSWENEKGTCPPAFSMAVQIAYAYPAWEAPKDADPALVEQWKQQLDAAWCFHWGAARLVLASASDLLAKLRAIEARDPAPSCEDAKAAALVANDQASQQLSDAVDAYNLATDKGRKVGAHFP